MKRICIVCLIVFLSVYGIKCGYSQKNYQPGYIINFANDTLNGSINYKNWGINPKEIFFKNEKGEISRLTSEDIKSFFVSGENYVSAIVNIDANPYKTAVSYSNEYTYKTDTVFLRSLVLGKKSLYFYKGMEGKEHFFIGTDEGYELLHHKLYFKDVGGAKTVFTDKKYIRQLNYYFQDCPEIKEKLKNTLYNSSDLIRLFLKYYSLKNELADFHEQDNRVKTDICFIAGVSISKLQFKGNINDDLVEAGYSPSMNIPFGVSFDIHLPRNLQKWSVNNELLFTSYKMEGDFSERSSETIYTTLGYSYIKLNNMLRYRYSFSKSSFFLNAGISSGFVVKEINEKRTEHIYQTSEDEFEVKIKEERALKESRKYEAGVIIGAGCNYKNFLLEIRHEVSNGISKYVDLKSPVNRTYILLGYKI